jgi:hypothetical protein
MSTAPPPRPGPSVAVTVIGLLTVLWGGAYAALGGSLVFAAAAASERLGAEDQAGGLAEVDRWLTSFFAGLATAVGVVLLVQGVLGVLAGSGVLWRKPWGRILAFVVAALALLWGLLFLGGHDRGPTSLALGAAQVLYGAVAFVVLIRNGAEFSRPQV